MLAFSLGLGVLVQNETRLKLHMKAELDNNDTPFGLLLMTGRMYIYITISNGAQNWTCNNIDGLDYWTHLRLQGSVLPRLLELSVDLNPTDSSSAVTLLTLHSVSDSALTVIMKLVLCHHEACPLSS